MVVITVLTILICLGYYFLVYKPHRGEKPSDIADNLVLYEGHSHSKSDYVVGYDPIHEDGSGNTIVHRRCALLVKDTTLTRYNNGEVATVRLYLDIDWYVPNDLITIEDRLNLVIISNVRRNANHFYYLAKPLEHLTQADFYFAKSGTRVYRLDRKLTEAENKYLLETRLDVEVATYKFKDFNLPYKPHKQGGYVSPSSNNRSASDDIVDDLMTNPLLSPISPINIWDSDGNSSSSSDSSWSSYDSGSSDSGGSCD